MEKESPFVLDRKHVNRMLVHILKVGEVGSMDFSWLTTNWRIVDENLSAMVDAGILKVRVQTQGRKSLRYSLTDMGRCVAIAELVQEESIKRNFDVTDDMIGEDLRKLWSPDGKLARLTGSKEPGGGGGGRRSRGIEAKMNPFFTRFRMGSYLLEKVRARSDRGTVRTTGNRFHPGACPGFDVYGHSGTNLYP